MTNQWKSVGFVCMANFCRSPVAKMLFKNKYENLLKVDSAGLNPMVSAGMDLRSINYLKANNIFCEIHSPKKIDKSFLDSSDIVFAMDTHVLMSLNTTFKHYRDKFKLFSYQHRNIHIKDPFRFSEEKYKDVMDQIKHVIDLFELEDFC
tara:strand:+ start:1050 stop:1496 length:447 start_codon:yes stop_codon:yes gene_type:complete